MPPPTRSKRKATEEPPTDADSKVENGVDDVLKQRTEELDRWQKEQDEREAALQKRENDLSTAEEEFANETAKAFGSTTPDDILRLNIGGTRVQVQRSTICYAEGSLLASMFSGRWDDSLSKDNTGAYFIHQPYEQFKALLDFFRSCMCATADGPRASIVDVAGKIAESRSFIRMVDHYGCTPFVYPVEIEIHPQYNAKKKIEPPTITQYPDRSIEAHIAEKSTGGVASIFHAVSVGHKRKIKRIQFTLADHQHFAICFRATEVNSVLCDIKYFPCYGEIMIKPRGCDEKKYSLSKWNKNNGRPSKENNYCETKSGDVIDLELDNVEDNSNSGGLWLKEISFNGEMALAGSDFDKAKYDKVVGKPPVPCSLIFAVEGKVRITDLALFP